MRKIFALIAAVTVVAAANVASAVPTAYYNPANGAIFLSNDTGLELAVANLKSPSGKFNGENLAIPGTTNDFGDKPNFLVYFGLDTTTSEPSSWWKVGNAVQGGGPIGDIAFSFFTSFVSGQVEQNGLVVQVPEPTTIAMGGLGLIGIVAAARRRKA